LFENLKVPAFPDEAMKLFEEGVALSRECQKQLEEAEGKFEILLKRPTAGSPRTFSTRKAMNLIATRNSVSHYDAMKTPSFFEEDCKPLMPRWQDSLRRKPLRRLPFTKAMRYSVFAGGKRDSPDSLPRIRAIFATTLLPHVPRLCNRIHSHLFAHP